MPKETFVSPEIAIIKNIQGKIRGMEKYFRQLTADQTIKVILNANQNSIIISSKELSEKTVAILKEQIEPFHTKFNNKTGQTETVAQTKFEGKNIIVTFKNKEKLLNCSSLFKRKYQKIAAYSSIFRDFGFIYYLDNDNKFRFVNIVENILIGIKNDRIKKNLQETNSHSEKKDSLEITQLTNQAARIKAEAQQKFVENQRENEFYEEFAERIAKDESYKNLEVQTKKIFAELYQNARVGFYDHYEQSRNSNGIFYFHRNLLKTDEIYAKANTYHEEMHELHQRLLEIIQTDNKVTFPSNILETPDEIIFQFKDITQAEQFIKTFGIQIDPSIRYCEVLENLIEEICPSINNDNIRKIYNTAVEAINTFKTDPALSSAERLNQLQMFLENLVENPNSEKPKSATATKSSSGFGQEIKGSFSGQGLFSFKKTKNKTPALSSETKTEPSVAEIFMIEVLKKTQLSIEKLLKEENKESFSSTTLSQ